MNQRSLSITAVAVLMLLAAPPSFAAGNANKEIATATAHAQMAAVAPNTATAVMHFHHVINCLVGAKGKDFDAGAGDPCKGMGNGALNDLGHATAIHARLERALVLSERALHAVNIKTARHDAARIAQVLKAANSIKSKSRRLH